MKLHFTTCVIALCVGVVLSLATCAVAQATPRLWSPSTPELGAVLDTVDGEAIHYNAGRREGPDTPTGTQWQCVEFVQRYFHDKWGITGKWPIGMNAYNMIDHLPAGVHATRNGDTGGPRPQPGDALVFDGDASNGGNGHVALVTEVRGGRIYFAQQNVGKVTRDSIPIDGAAAGNSGEHIHYPKVLGWVHADSNTPPVSNTTPPQNLPQQQVVPNPNFVCLGGSSCSPSGGTPPKTTGPLNLPKTPICDTSEELIGGHCKPKKTGCEAEGYECSKDKVPHCNDDQYLDHGECKNKQKDCDKNQVSDEHGGCKDKGCRPGQERHADGDCSDKPNGGKSCGGTEGEHDKPCPVKPKKCDPEEERVSPGACEYQGGSSKGETTKKKQKKEDLSEYDRKRCADGKLGNSGIKGCTPNR